MRTEFNRIKKNKSKFQKELARRIKIWNKKNMKVYKNIKNIGKFQKKV